MTTLTLRAPETRRTLLYNFAALLAGALVVALLLNGQGRAAIAVTAAGLFTAMALVNIRAAVLGVMVYVTFVGDLRRMLIPFFTWTGTDPLLLVSAFFVIVVFAAAFASGALRIDTPIARLMVGLMGIMVLQMFNPAQGGLIVGVAGSLFIIVPLLWFWVGRTYATPKLLRALFFRVIVPLSLVGAAMGTYQVFYGYLPYQKLWVATNWYAGLGSPDHPAPVSLFASNTEYGNYTVIGAVVLWAAFLSRRRPALLLIPLLVAAVLLTGTRGPVAKLLVVGAGMWAVIGTHKSAWVARGAFALFVGAAGLAWTITAATENLAFDASVQTRLDRQAEEFVNEDDPYATEEEFSSSNAHFDMWARSYTWAIANPLGLGLGATSQASSKFGGTGHSSETDLGDSFITSGVIGGIVYHIMVVLIVTSTLRYWLRTRSLEALALMGILGVTFLQWQGGGAYAVSTIVWFCIGALDGLANRPDRADALAPA